VVDLPWTQIDLGWSAATKVAGEGTSTCFVQAQKARTIAAKHASRTGHLLRRYPSPSVNPARSPRCLRSCLVHGAPTDHSDRLTCKAASQAGKALQGGSNPLATTTTGSSPGPRDRRVRPRPHRRRLRPCDPARVPSCQSLRSLKAGTFVACRQQTRRGCRRPPSERARQRSSHLSQSPAPVRVDSGPVGRQARLGVVWCRRPEPPKRDGAATGSPGNSRRRHGTTTPRAGQNGARKTNACTVHIRTGLPLMRAARNRARGRASRTSSRNSWLSLTRA
jgi:hypothetical protein